MIASLDFQRVAGCNAPAFAFGFGEAGPLTFWAGQAAVASGRREFGSIHEQITFGCHRTYAVVRGSSL
jgi:hypothetical protein